MATTSSNSPSMAPDEIRNARFSTGFRGYDTTEVRAFLARVAGSYAELSARVFEVDRVTVVPPTSDVEAVGDESESEEDMPDYVAAEAEREANRAEITEMLAAARNESHAIVAKANDEAARIILRARAESRGKPSGDAMAVVEAAFADSPTDPVLAREQARLMISEAKAVRERILTDLAKRRKVAHVQLEQLRVAKEKLQESLREARRVVDDAARDLGTAEVEARLAAETAGRRVAAEVEPTGSDLEAELFGAGSILRGRLDSRITWNSDALPTADQPADDSSVAALTEVDVVVRDVVEMTESVDSFDETEVDVAAVDEVVLVRVDAEVAEEDMREPAVLDVVEIVEVMDDVSVTEDANAGETGSGVDSADAGDGQVARPSAAKRSGKNVDELFARLRADREAASASAREVLGVVAASPSASAPVSPSKSSSKLSTKSSSKLSAKPLPKGAGPETHPDAAPQSELGRGTDIAVLEGSGENVDIIDLVEFPSVPLDLRLLIGADATDGELLSVERVPESVGLEGGDAEPDGDTEAEPGLGARQGEDERLQYVTGPLQGQLVRALRRFMLDEQSSTLAALRTARGRVRLEELVGVEAVHRQRIVDAVQSHFVDAYRAGADPSKAGGEDFVAEVVRPFAANVADVIGGSVRTELAVGVEAASSPESDRMHLVDAIGTCYRAWTTDRMSALSHDQLVACFALGRER